MDPAGSSSWKNLTSRSPASSAMNALGVQPARALKSLLKWDWS
jgi:hypothetical protein